MLENGRKNTFLSLNGLLQANTFTNGYVRRKNKIQQISVTILFCFYSFPPKQGENPTKTQGGLLGVKKNE